MKYTVVIADDHLLIAKALTGIIDAFQQYEVLYEVENGIALQERFKQGRNIPDIVLLDISMPQMDGFETAAWLKQQHPAVRIMALSMQDDEKSLVRMIKSGASGYMHKNVHPADLEQALNMLMRKGFYYPDWATAKILHNIGDGQEDILEEPIKLNPRELEFLAYACSEMTYKEIGEKMFISSRTVESYRDSLFEKLGLKTRVGLVLYAVKHGIGPV